ncbi:MAG: hypothetical protein GX584_03040, partial [Clostridiaceae bacterium]|nr:hypothetical protein [Clostridiaceae bacterium]
MISDYSEIIEKCLENVDQTDQLLIEQAVTEYIYSENNRDIYNKEEMIE